MESESEQLQIQQQVLFWAAIGPFLFLLTMLIALMQTSPAQLSLIIAALIGVPLCWKWKLKGLAAAAGLLTAVFAYYFTTLSFEQCLWCSGIIAATLLSYLVTALSLEEAAALIRALQVESKSRLSTLWNLDEKLKDTEAKSVARKKELEEALAEVENELEILKDRQEADRKENRILHEELAAMHAKYDSIKASLYQTRVEKAKIDEKFHTLQVQFEFSEEERQSVERAFEELQAAASNSDAELFEQIIEEKDQELSILRHRYEELKSSSEERERVLKKMVEEASKGQKEPKELQRAKSQCKQLKDKLKQKEEELQESRNSLFRMQERLLEVRSRNSAAAPSGIPAR